MRDLAPAEAVASIRSGQQLFVTEHGLAELFGRSIRERVTALIGIAYPTQREDLEREAHRLYHVDPAWQ